MSKKKLLIALIAVSAIAGTTYAVNETLAFGWGQENNSDKSFIERIVEKFNLNEEEVNNELNKWHEERQAQMQELRKERLNQAVTDSVITEEQKNKLLEREEQNWQNRDQHREEMQKWFSENNIDHAILAPYLGGGFGRGQGMHRNCK